MKNCFLFFILVFIGCDSSTNPPKAITSSLQKVSKYIAPGTFIGTWEYYEGQTVKFDTNPCRVVLTEADSVISGTMTNTQTGEVLQFNGVASANTSDVIEPYSYRGRTINQETVTDTLAKFEFSIGGDTLGYSGAGGWIFSVRQN